MEVLEIQYNLVSFIHKNLISRLRPQFGLPAIDGLRELLTNQELSVPKLRELQEKIAAASIQNDLLRTELLTLTDAQILHTQLKDNEPSCESIESCFVILLRLKTREDFNIELTLNSIESSIIHALNGISDREHLKRWLTTIKGLNSTFNHDITTLMNWLEVKLIQTLLIDIQNVEPKGICSIIKFIREMITEKFKLEDISRIAIDSALYIIAELEVEKSKGLISEILGVIIKIDTAEIFKNRIYSYAKKYGVRPDVDDEGFFKEEENFVKSKNEVEIGDAIYTRDVAAMDDTYKVCVNKARIRTSNVIVAVKSYKSASMEVIKQFEEEVRILKMLSQQGGPYVKYLGSYLDSELDDDSTTIHELGIVMQFCPKTLSQKLLDLRRKKQEFTEDELLKIIVPLLDGYVLLTESDPKIFHQDIKPDNVFFSLEDKVLIGDFNITSIEHLKGIIETTGMDSVRGTLSYMAPEVSRALDEGGGDFHRHQADVYSFGLTLLQMYTREANTYNGSGQAKQREKKIQEIRYHWLQDMIKACLIEDFRDRPEFKTLTQFLPHQTVMS